MEDREKLKAVLKACGLTRPGERNKPDFDKIAKITGHSRDSLKSMLAPSKHIPRWLKLTVYVWETQNLMS